MLGGLELLDPHLDQAEAHVGLVDDLLDGQVVRFTAEEGLRDPQRPIVVLPRGGDLADDAVDVAELLIGDRLADVGRGPGGAPLDLLEAADRRVEQAAAERAGRGGLGQPLLHVVDELIERLQREVPLIEGGQGLDGRPCSAFRAARVSS